ncbi:response regulator [Parasphaerochaeta coccoides]|uniref:Two component transcriptional regulator, AraC family n=1 Tax=Parasphaerochaeta coccoides (strain ATCC BAA-1237 / DSM 17374 / SPN1) TaxID=760011 RepID=F4GJS6_PARC1|nr:response regulator [Parasphaerochaeta coccoides]AEC02823.1 two component transcriptional regulator, AraC family [Parasphaerochaeta coccoides DSM 17374]
MTHTIQVIILDDEPRVSKLIASLIDWESLGMEICATAQDGITALQLIKDLSPDLVITDIRMPGHDGLELIQRAREISKDLDFIIISGYRYFEYAQTAIKYGVGDYLLKPIKKQELMDTLLKFLARYKERTEKQDHAQKLNQHLDAYYSKLREDLFKDCILGAEPDSFSSMEEINQAYHYDFRPGLFQVCIVKLDMPQQEFFPQGKVILKEKVERILMSFCKPLCSEIESYAMDSRFYILLNYEQDKKNAIRKSLKTMLDELIIHESIFPSSRFFLAVGPSSEDFASIPRSARSAWSVCCQRLVATGGSQLYEEVPPSAGEDDIHALLKIWNEGISKAVSILSLEETQACIASLIDTLSSEKSFSGENILDCLQQAFSNFLMRMKTTYVSIEGLESAERNYEEGQDMYSSAAELYAFFSEKTLKFLEENAALIKEQEYRPVRLAKKYISEHFNDPMISLNSVSDAMGFNSSYFSSLFKKESGMGFLEYLSDVRMTHAKYLLKTTTLPIADICKKAGYTDTKYFTQAFQKNTGIRPKDYRKLYS